LEADCIGHERAYIPFLRFPRFLPSLAEPIETAGACSLSKPVTKDVDTLRLSWAASRIQFLKR
jgi:hypothetical protein